MCSATAERSAAEWANRARATSVDPSIIIEKAVITGAAGHQLAAISITRPIAIQLGPNWVAGERCDESASRDGNARALGIVETSVSILIAVRGCAYDLPRPRVVVV